MKISIIGTAWPYRGGLATFNERLTKEFIRLGYEAELYTFTLQYPSFLFPGKSQYTDEPRPKDLKIERCINSINPINWIQVGRKIRKEAPDILVFRYWIPAMAPCFGSIARVVRGNKKTCIVAIADNVIPHETRIADKILSRFFISSMDGFVVMTKQVMEDLHRFDDHKPRILMPHPLYDNYGELCSKEVARKKLSLDPSGKYLLFFGFIRPYKGLDLLLEAMADERIRQSNVCLIIAGEFYTDPSPYKERVKRLGIENKIIWHNDFIPNGEVGVWFNAADLVVQPYKTATQSGVTQVAYHFEKPMIVTRVGGLPEMVPDGKVGYVVSPSPEDLSRAIIDFYSQEDTEAKFLANLRKEKLKYTWDKMANAILSLNK